jgi:hypothetical protein
MKTLLTALLACGLLAAGCALYPKNKTSACDRPENAGCLLCTVADQAGVTVEQMDTALLDATLLAVASKQVTVDDMRQAIGAAQEAVALGAEGTSLDGLVRLLAANTKVDPLLIVLLQRRLAPWTSVPDVPLRRLSPADLRLIQTHLERQAAQFKDL